MIQRIAQWSLLIGFVAVLEAQPPETQASKSPPTKPRRVFALVNDAELLVAELDARLRQLPEAKDADTVRQRRKVMIETLVRQQLVTEYLRRRSLGATGREIQAAYRKWKSEIAARDLEPSEYFRRTGMDEAAIRRRYEWQIGWMRYVERKLNKTTLEKYFEDHKTDFDGTRMRVAHILWKPSSGEALKRIEAKELREQIVSGKLTFEDAAKLHSQAPTAGKGGEIGWIERHKPMHPDFSSAAFRLQSSEISQPVKTPFGLHLIKSLEIEPGQRSFRDVLPAVKRAATNDMFRTLAARERRSGKIKVRKLP